MDKKGNYGDGLVVSGGYTRNIIGYLWIISNVGVKGTVSQEGRWVLLYIA